MLLTDKEIGKILFDGEDLYDYTIEYPVGGGMATDASPVSQDIAKAQLKKVVEWLQKNGYIYPCDTDGIEYEGDFLLNGDQWQQLLKEIE